MGNISKIKANRTAEILALGNSFWWTNYPRKMFHLCFKML